MIALCEYLEEEVPTVLAGDVVGLGEGRTDGSSRAPMIKEFERIHAATCIGKGFEIAKGPESQDGDG